jgi:hypothetical protein
VSLVIRRHVSYQRPCEAVFPTSACGNAPSISCPILRLLPLPNQTSTECPCRSRWTSGTLGVLCVSGTKAGSGSMAVFEAVADQRAELVSRMEGFQRESSVLRSPLESEQLIESVFR